MPRPRVFFQGDYELLSSQFAGLVVAAKKGIFKAKGIDVILRGRVRPGSEADVVAAIQEAVGEKGGVALGCAEQNIVVPAQHGGAPVKVISAMYHKSPLGLGLLPSSRITSLKELAHRESRVGMLADSLTLAQRMMHQAAGSTSAYIPEVVEVTNENKIGLLLAGKLDAIQIYDATEPVEIQIETGHPPRFLPFLPSLGYAQAIFAHSTALTNEKQRDVITTFLACMYQGWEEALNDPRATAALIMEARREAHVAVTNPKIEKTEYFEKVLRNLEAYVRPPAGKSKMGLVDPGVYDEASAFFVKAGLLSKAFPQAKSLDTTLWA
ncbi:hypothetical protein VYU27_010042 [Nannochloropsis oceanica]